MTRRRVLLLVFDIALIMLAFYVSLLLRFEGQIPARNLDSFIRMLPIIIGLSMVCFLGVNLYSCLWKYASIKEMCDIVKAVSLDILGIISLSAMVGISNTPRSVYIISWALGIIMIGASRLSWRVIREYQGYRTRTSRVAIVGAGTSGITLAQMMKPNVIGFVDDYKDGATVMGLPVLGTTAELDKIVSKYGIKEVIVTAPLQSRKLSQLIHECKDAKVVVKVIDKVNGELSPKLRAPSVEDLLGREPIKMEIYQVAAYLTGRRVLVSGAGGSIGSELCRQIARFNPGLLIAVDFSENNVFELHNELEKVYPNLPLLPVLLDVKDKPSLFNLFLDQKPEVVFHAAAFKHVPMMERHPALAFNNNVIGTENIIKASLASDVKSFVFISTDKAVDPANAMGASKRLGELLATQANAYGKGKFTAVRFGNVLGSRGSVIPVFMKQIEAGGPVTVTDADMTRYFMTIQEASQLVIQAGAMSQGGEVFVLDMGQPVRIYDLAEDLVRLSGLTPGKDIEIQVTGIRPGEKLEEVLFADDEKLDKTRHKRIMVARENPGPGEFEKLKARFFDQWIAPSTKKPILELAYNRRASDRKPEVYLNA